MRIVVLAIAAVTCVPGCDGCDPADPRDPESQAVAGGEDPALPGIAEPDPELSRALREALEAKGEWYEPRTRHVGPDGSPRFVNRLILETSPYLLRHAHDPVSWFPWSEEAFERAREEDRPVLLSIGYSTCRRCRRTEREPFEDLEIARLLNEHFVAVKVDREERPDVAGVYGRAVQLLGGDPGWPTTVLLTPDRRPFSGDAHLPKDRLASLLRQMRDRYRRDRESLVERAEDVSAELARRTTGAGRGERPGEAVASAAFRALERRYDPTNGGFGEAPERPVPSRLLFLVCHHRRTGEERALEMVVHTLDRLAAGGIHDQIGGGFHRHSDDPRWLVPHFDKMLYDNAQLAAAYLEAHELTGEERFARIARDVLDYVAREMTGPDGGFHSATGDDSPGPDGRLEEGRFYTWTPAELRELLSRRRARIAMEHWGVTEGGHLDGRSILHLSETVEEVSRSLGLPEEDVREHVAAARQQLYSARLRRPAPRVDDRVLTAWNGLMIGAFARGAHAFDDRGYERRARAAAEMVLERLRDDDGTLHRSYRLGQARHPAYLDDYAFLGSGLLDLHGATGDERWLREALSLQETQDRLFLDREGGGWFMSGDAHGELVARDKPSEDGAIPSGNAVAIENALRLAELTSDDALRRRAERALSAFGPRLRESPADATRMLCALDLAP